LKWNGAEMELHG